MSGAVLSTLRSATQGSSVICVEPRFAAYEDVSQNPGRDPKSMSKKLGRVENDSAVSELADGLARQA